MIRLPSLPSRARVLVLLFATACAKGSDSPDDSEVKEGDPQPKLQPAASQDRGHPPEMDAPAAEAPDPLAGPPPLLSVLGEGRCRYLGSSLVEDDVYLHYETVIGRVEGGAVRKMPVPERAASDAQDRGIAGLVIGVAGAGDHLLLRFDRMERREGPQIDHAWWNGQLWQGLSAVPSTHDVLGVWPWGSADWLGFAWTCEQQRLMVVRGPGKGPQLSRLGCHAPRVVDVVANAEGHALAALQCGDARGALWVAHWQHPDRDGSAQRVRTAPKSADSTVD
jgi:hypothetical protein